MGFDYTPNRFIVSEIGNNKNETHVWSHFLAEDNMIEETAIGFGHPSAANAKTYGHTSCTNINENSPEKIFATDDERSESEKPISSLL